MFEVNSWDEPPNQPPTHYLDTRIHTEQIIFEEEKHSILAGCWRLVCHSSELPDSGDYRTVELAGKSIIVLRGRDGQVRAFLNTCPHRGAQLLRKVRGKITSELQCLYHLWTFDLHGRCTGITRPEGYEASGLQKNHVGLHSLPTAVVCGLVFVSLNDNVEPIEQFLGPMIDHLQKHLTDDLDVFHYHSAEIAGNWKLFVDNDSEQYHEFLHVLNRTTGMRHPSYHDRLWQLYPNGHSIIDQNEINYAGFGLDRREENLMPGMRPNGMVVMLIFPDVMINVRSTVMRIDTQTPIDPGRTYVQWRGLGLRNDSPAVRSMRIQHHNEVWGPAGRNLIEDVIAVECQWKNMASRSSKYNFIAREEGLRPQDDANLRAFYQEWGRRLGRAPHDPFGERAPRHGQA